MTPVETCIRYHAAAAPQITEGGGRNTVHSQVLTQRKRLSALLQAIFIEILAIVI